MCGVIVCPSRFFDDDDCVLFCVDLWFGPTYPTRILVVTLALVSPEAFDCHKDATWLPNKIVIQSHAIAFESMQQLCLLYTLQLYDPGICW